MPAIADIPLICTASTGSSGAFTYTLGHRTATKTGTHQGGTPFTITSSSTLREIAVGDRVRALVYPESELATRIHE